MKNILSFIEKNYDNLIYVLYLLDINKVYSIHNVLYFINKSESYRIVFYIDDDGNIEKYFIIYVMANLDNLMDITYLFFPLPKSYGIICYKSFLIDKVSILNGTTKSIYENATTKIIVFNNEEKKFSFFKIYFVQNDPIYRIIFSFQKKNNTCNSAICVNLVKINNRCNFIDSILKKLSPKLNDIHFYF